jgi:hypothetical protein
MAAAAAHTASRRLTGQTLADVRRRSRELHPCKIRGCKRTAYKGSLCKAHWSMVPVADRVALTVAAMQAQHATAAKFHRRFLRDVQARCDAL